MNATLTKSTFNKNQAVFRDTAGHHHTLLFERRRYSNRTYTWVYLKTDEQWVQLGDPWPTVMPAKAELQEAIGRLLAAGKA